MLDRALGGTCLRLVHKTLGNGIFKRLREGRSRTDRQGNDAMRQVELHLLAQITMTYINRKDKNNHEDNSSLTFHNFEWNKEV